MEYLDNHDKSEIMNMLEHIGHEHMTDVQLVLGASNKLEELDSTTNYYNDFKNNILQMMYFISRTQKSNAGMFDERKFKKTCRGGLYYFIKSDDIVHDQSGPAGFIDDAWLANYIVTQIASEDSTIKPCSLPELSKAEKKEAAHLLMEESGKKTKDVKVIMYAAVRVSEKIKQFETVWFIKDLLGSIKKLVALIDRFIKVPNFNENDYAYRIALGALRYLARQDDLIPDEFGVIGYLDDSYVAKTAIELITKNSAS